MIQPKYTKGDTVEVEGQEAPIVSVIPHVGGFYYEVHGLDGFYAENELKPTQKLTTGRSHKWQKRK